jgi:hypothetical protein
MKKRILTGLLFVVITVVSLGQDISFPELEGFKKSTQYPVYTNTDLWSFIDGAADAYVALGFIDLHVIEYKKGKETIKLEIYRHSDHTMAFGIYASERSSAFRFVNLGSQGYITGGAINFFKGNYYVKIRTYSVKAKTLHAEESLASIVANMLGGETDMPALLSKFPDENRKVNEETFINESVLGHEFLNKAFKADYLVGTDNFSIYLIKFNSPQEALKTGKAYLSAAGVDLVESNNVKCVISDGYNGTVFLSWYDDTMVIISGLAKDQSDIADKYTSEIIK